MYKTGMTIFRLLAVTLLLNSLSAHVAISSAETPEEKGLAIAKEADLRDTGWEDMKAAMTMTLRNKTGKESVRALRVKMLEVAGDGDKSLMVFDKPRDVKGTGLLTYSHKSGTDDQWLYLPAIKRVKRIASNNKTGPFMASEFSYEDMTSPEVEKFTYKYIKDEVLNSLDCFVVERYPVDENSGYTREVVWVDKEHYRPFKIEYYDRKKSRLKTLTVSGYKKYAGKFWRPDSSLMTNHQTGKSTTLGYKDYKFKVGIKSNIFKPAKLKNVR